MVLSVFAPLQLCIYAARHSIFCGFKVCQERYGQSSTRSYFGRGYVDSEVPFFLTLDHLGSVRDMTDANGAVRARYEYDAYGRKTKLAGDKDSTLTFASYLDHSSSGLFLATFRAYSADLGRWLNEDPIGFLGGSNRYRYANGNPTKYTDPLGLKVTSIRNPGNPPADSGPLPEIPPDKDAIAWVRVKWTTYPCDQRGDTSWGYDMTVERWQGTRYREGFDPQTPSRDEPGITTEDHENNHHDDFDEFYSEEYLMSEFRTEGFCTQEECEEDRAKIDTELKEFILWVDGETGRRRHGR